MQDEHEDIYEDYNAVPHKVYCALLSTVEAKDNRKRSPAQIKRLAASKAATENYDSDTYERVMRKKQARNGVLPALKNQG